MECTYNTTYKIFKLLGIVQTSNELMQSINHTEKLHTFTGITMLTADGKNV